MLLARVLLRRSRNCLSLDSAASPSISKASRAGFTLTEILVATALTVLMLGMVVQIFALVSDGVRETRGVVEVNDRLRAASSRLQLDLAGVTANLAKTPPLRPEDNEGYFEYIEGPVGPVIPPTAVVPSGTWAGYPVVASSDVDELNNFTLQSTTVGAFTAPDGIPDPDTTVGDVDDVLMFTTRSNGAPFIGKFNGDPAQSPVAEVCWFLRGTTLYRRVLLVLPDRTIPEGDDQAPGFYADYDVSVRQFGGPFSRLPSPVNTAASARIVPNTLGDLTNRQNRYGHQPWAWPHDARFWGRLGLPTLRECTYRVIDVANPNTATMTRTPREFGWPFPLQHSSTEVTFVPGKYLYGAVDAPNQLVTPRWRRLTSGSIDATAVGLFATNGSDSNTNSPQSDHIGLRYNAPYPASPPPTQGVFDAWRSPNAWGEVDAVTGGIRAYSADPDPNSAAVDGESVRTLDDVILTNVVSFDVKIWDPGAPVFLATDAAGLLLSDTGRPFSPPPATAPANSGVVLPGDPGYAGNPANSAAVLQRACDDALNNGVINNNFLLPISAGAYVDLNYMCRVDGNNNGSIDYDEARVLIPSLPAPLFHHRGEPRSFLFGERPRVWTVDLATTSSFPANALYPGSPALAASPGPPRPWALSAVYDTGSTSYEQDGLNQDYVMGTDEVADEGTNGQDDGGIAGQADDLQEKEAPVPYAQPVRGIQIKIRVYDPDSRQIREVTVVQDFVK